MRKTIYTKLDTLFSARYVRENELNYIAIRDMLTNIEEILEKHGKLKSEHITLNKLYIHCLLDLMLL